MRPPFKGNNKRGYSPRLRDGLWRGWGWFVVPEWNITIGASPKCGSSSLKQFFYMHEMDNVQMIKTHQVNPNADIYFVVRNPYERFVSLWKSKCRDEENLMDKDVHGMSPQALMTHIAGGKRDAHWTPQVELLNGLNANLIPLPKLNDWWSNRGYGELGTFNETAGEMFADKEIQDWVSDFYAKDYELYSGVLDLL